VDEFVKEVVERIRARYPGAVDASNAEVNV
jgi:hypothetical protein